MNAEAHVQKTRRLVIAAIVVGLGLGLVGLFVGTSIPGLVMTVAGWAVVIAGIAWLITRHSQRSSAASRAGSWRPGDGKPRP
ncbi:hypothetical protein NQ156_12315 [Microbacterium sp. zg.Y625]|uniref:hypothetical protein n=1 Tax=Microbacterium jiangjiandongii TaxID=3049071 RepID=UPI00214ABCA6|nr:MULTISPECIES: hypothetical protein [unclassified Microbacterium]MCR2793849.1 hypothetical protein [Microbacterium sp. zg.Y625]MCR2816071.1 hypothetical protein [Microbacterium sp. zg.Y843]WIM26188.1 hypothetical protein QNO14_03795 [Microbacterium sp. zg-Y625]